MKKEIINGVITILFMCVITILSIFVISLCVFRWKWQADAAMQAITGTYIISGLAGGLLHGRLGPGIFRRRKNSQWNGGTDIGRRVGIFGAFLYGIVLASVYWGVPGGITMLLVKENISDMGRFAISWGMMTGSITAGILLMTCVTGRKHKKQTT